MSSYYTELDDDRRDEIEASILDRKDTLLSARESRNFLISRYVKANEANNGDIIQCAYCGKKIEKKRKTQKFCSNTKDKKSKCGAKYWGIIDKKRCTVMMRRLVG